MENQALRLSFLTLKDHDFFKDHEVLFVIGGNIHDIYPRLKGTLDEKEDRRLVFLQEEAMGLPVWLDQDPKISLFILNDANQEELFKQMAWETVFLRACCFLACDEDKSAWASFVCEKLDRTLLGVHLVASDYQDMGAKIFHNIKRNVPHLSRAKEGRALAGTFKNVPAIICGAGPSLAQNIDLLKTLGQNALLFAGGSALNIFSSHSLAPHFTASIDPEPLYMRISEQMAKDVPLFYQNRTSSEIVSKIHSSLLWMPSSGGYPIEEWLMEQLGMEAKTFDGGWNVATFCTAIASFLGCDPIIFVGVDLASRTKKCYSPGVDAENAQEDLIQISDEEGGSLYTRSDWLMAAEWLEGFVKDHPEHCFINTSQEGISLKGVPYLSLSDVKDRYLQNFSDLKEKVDVALAAVPSFEIEEANIAACLQTLEKSCHRCSQLCDQMLGVLARFYPESPFEKGEFILLDVELEEEIAYQKILQPIWDVWGQIFLRHFEKDAEGLYKSTLNRLLFYKKILAAYR